MTNKIFSLLLLILNLNTIILGQKIYRTEILSDSYQVEWEADLETKEIIFQVLAKTLGYVGFGISPNGGMQGADIVIGGVGDDGQHYFTDRFAETTQEPLIDPEENWTLISASENSTHTILKFFRVFETCDINDNMIGPDTTHIIWSYGQSDDVQYHDGNRGSVTLNLLDPSMPLVDISKFKSFELSSEVEMPGLDTTYWCTMHKSPEENTTHHIVGIRPIMETAIDLKHNHHILVFSCQAPLGIDPDIIFGPVVGQAGATCVNSAIFLLFCAQTVLAWSVGGKEMFYPDNVGLPMREEGKADYYLFEVHLDNPGEDVGVKVKSGLEVFYTDQLREHDGGILIVEYTMGWTQTIPPGVNNFMSVGHCSSECTQTHIPETGIHVFNVLLHSHLAGIKMKTRHFRNNSELAWLASDDNYDFNYQQFRHLRNEVTILPGDQLTQECIYDVSERKGGTIGGLSSKQEMCTVFLTYYPRVKMRDCRSGYPKDLLLKMLGIDSLISIVDSVDPLVMAPLKYVLRTYSQVVNMVMPQWTTEQIQDYQKKVRFDPHLGTCAADFNLPLPQNNSEILQNFVTYPDLPNGEYKPPEGLCKPLDENTTPTDNSAHITYSNLNLNLLTFSIIMLVLLTNWH